MELFFALLLFAVGFFVLVKGANVLIRGAVSLAQIFKLTPWVIGVVIVGIGTSIPEFSITVASVFEGNNVGLATIIGTNIFNIFVILGLTAIIAPFTFRREWVVYDLPINIGAVLVVTLAILVPLFGQEPIPGISRYEGLLLCALLGAWILFMLRRKPDNEYEGDVEAFSWVVSLVFVAAGLIGVFFGGQWIVDGATVFATAAGVSPALIGFTIVAVGTSLPELAVTIAALRQRQSTMAIGNVIGSNVFNFLGIFGITALVHPIVIREAVQFDILAILGATILLLLAALYIGCRFQMTRAEGVLFLTLYVVYIAFIVLRG